MVKVLEGKFCGEFAICPDMVAENAEYGCSLAIIKVHVCGLGLVAQGWNLRLGVVRCSAGFLGLR
jgi:hypothetical protein